MIKAIDFSIYFGWFLLSQVPWWAWAAFAAWVGYCLYLLCKYGNFEVFEE